MVAHLVRLKLSLLRNSLRRSVPQLIGMVLAAVYALGVTGLVVTCLVTLGSPPTSSSAARSSSSSVAP